jgi:ParB family chromosome partitioning protein
LDALLPSGGGEAAEEGVREIPTSQITPNRLQPRQRFDAEKLAELAGSIREHGLVQPVVVRTTATGYELIVGERRWRAAQQAGLRSIPAVIKDIDSDADVLQVALVENLQREDLNPLEEAAAFQYLVGEFGLTQEEVAKRVGRSRPQVANTLRLLNLDAEIREAIQVGELSMGHAKVLLSLPEAARQKQLFRRIIETGLSVREAEDAARSLSETKAPAKARKKDEASPAHKGIEEELRNVLATRVRVRSDGDRGQIEVEFYSEEDLVRIVETIVGKG